LTSFYGEGQSKWQDRSDRNGVMEINGGQKEAWGVQERRVFRNANWWGGVWGWLLMVSDFAPLGVKKLIYAIVGSGGCGCEQ